MDPAVQAASIRRQVEYYFCDENLETDRFLQKAMKNKNLPIKLKVICGFKKMRPYPIEDVERALQDNPVVSLIDVNGALCIQRKVPFVPQAKIASAKPKSKPTGFEEFYTDPPVTTEEFYAEEDLYALDRPFAERIETAIQRYSAKRRFNSHSRNIFDKWMRYGGVDAGPRMFSGGMDTQDYEDRTAAEIAAFTATNFVGEDKYDGTSEARWAVDFEGLAKGFLSTMVNYHWAFNDQAQFKEPTAIMRNFYNYILHHNVCPEYKLDILAAREICNIADAELYAAHQTMLSLPGDFNTACSTLFGGSQKAFYAYGKAWAAGNEGGSFRLGLSDKEARQVLAMGFAAYGPEHLFWGSKEENQNRLFDQTIVATEENVGLEVTTIIPASKEIRYLYEVKVHSGIKPLGKILCKPWTPPDFAEPDLPRGYFLPQRPEKYEFWIEQAILDTCFEGMKMEATVCTLSGGSTILDTVTTVKCSFYTALENEMTRKWREPRWISRKEQVERDRKWLENEESGQIEGDDD